MAQSEDEKAVQGIKDKSARKAAFYTRQRQNAGAGSDTQKKIQGKLSWGDSVRGFAKDQMQKISSSGPWSLPGGKEAEAAEGAIGGAAKALSSGARGLAKRAGGAIEDEVQHLRNPTPVTKISARGAAAKAKRQSEGKPDHWFQEKPKSSGASKSQKVGSLTKSKTKALGTSEHKEFGSELAKQGKKKVPAQPKTFNRNGTKRAEGRKKSDRNPVSSRKNSTAKSEHMKRFG